MKTNRTTTDLDKRLLAACLKLKEEELALIELIMDKLISGDLILVFLVSGGEP